MKKTILWLIILVMIITPVSFAKTNSAAKQEVVYAKLGGDGSVDMVSVVNVFRLPQSGRVTDFGDYQETINLTNLEPIEMAGDQISTRAQAGVFYYQGNQPKAEIPWLASLEYRLDGQTVSLEELAGATGELTIDLHVKPNPKADPVFRENYLLQISWQFPQNSFELIKAEGATEAINGEDKMLSFTVLPNKTADITIRAKVKDFAMKPLMINGLPFQMALDLPDLDGSLDDLKLLQDAIRQLNDGAQALAGGLGLAASGGSQLYTGADQLAGAGDEMSRGLSDFHSGLSQYGDGLNQYRDGVIQFHDGLSALLSGLDRLSDGLNSYAAGSDTATAGLNDYIAGVDSYVAGVNQALDMILPLVKEMEKAKDLLAGIDFSQAIELTRQAAEQIGQALDQIVAIIENIDLSQLEEIKANSARLLAFLESLDDPTGSLPGLGQLIGQLQSANQNLVQAVAELQVISTNLRTPDLAALGVDPEDPNTIALLAYMAAQADAIDSLIGRIQSGTIDPINQTIDSLIALDQTLQQLFINLSGLADLYRPIDQFIQSLDGEQLEALKQQALEAARQYGEWNKKLQAFLDEMDETLPEMLQQLLESIDQASSGLSQLRGAGDQIVAGGVEVKAGFKQLNDGAHDLAEGGAALADGARQIKGGSDELTGGITSLADHFKRMTQGSSQISWGLQQLSNGLAGYRDGVASYVNGVSQAGAGSRQLADGTNQLQQETDGLDDKFRETMDEMTKDLLPKEFDPVSFVSKKNKNIEVVQFVMMGPAINLPAENGSDEPISQSKTIWDRIIDLFKGIVE